MVIIRYFEPSDFTEILEIESEAFSEHNPLLYMNFYEMNNDGFLVAEYNEYVIGFVVGYEIPSNEGRIFSLAVKEGFRSMGIGAKLIKAINRIFITRFLQYASLEVRLTNKRAQSLYKRMGFVPCWVQHGYYSDGEDGVVMKKRLTPYSQHFLNNTSKNVLPGKISKIYLDRFI